MTSVAVSINKLYSIRVHCIKNLVYQTESINQVTKICDTKVARNKGGVIEVIFSAILTKIDKNFLCYPLGYSRGSLDSKLMNVVDFFNCTPLFSAPTTFRY